MNVDEVRIKLEGIKWLDEEMRGLQLELQYLEQGLLKKSALTQTKVQTSRVNTAENEVVYTIKLKQDIEEKLSGIISESLESSRLIDKASDPLERAVLRMFYVNRLEIWDIEKRLNRSKTTIYKIKRDGIESIARAMLWYNINKQKIDWNTMYIYIDESGSINNKLQTDFIITLVATDNKDSLKKSYKRFVSSNLENLRAADKKGQMFLNGKFKELKGAAFTPDLKIEFVEHFVKKDNFKLFYIHVHNSKLTDLFCSNTARVFNYNLRLALEAFIRRGLIPSEDHHLIIDERNIRTDSKGVLEEYLLTELVVGGINNGDIKITYVDSSNVQLVQLADVFSNLKYSRVVSDNKNYETEFQKLEKSVLKMTFNFPKSES